MRTGRAFLTGIGAGILGWSLTEYAVHRWVMHGPHTTNPVTAEHLGHHRQLERTDPLRLDRFLWWPATGGLLVGAGTAAATSGPVGLGAGLGWAASYCGYRHLHWLLHHRPPRNRAGRWLRRHHFRHHVGAPRGNHGVTSPLWDLVLGTHQRPDGPVRLGPALAPRWLFDDSGRPRADLASHLSTPAR
jgi:sterol desaturase/sphingolipid hydroxylase (fatty acid hydroxylase superfamily)